MLLYVCIYIACVLCIEFSLYVFLIPIASEDTRALTEEGRGAEGPRGQGELSPGGKESVEMKRLDDAGTRLGHVPGVDETDHTEVISYCC